jgi:hypothetical protein
MTTKNAGFEWENIANTEETGSCHTPQNDYNMLAKTRSRKTTEYLCEYPNCGKFYSQKYRLDIHKRTHVNLIL